MGYDGVELVCLGDHFEVGRALAEESYVAELWQKLQANDLSCYAISNHLVGQAVCDRIDERHKAILSPDVWGDGDPEGVRQRAAEEMKATARAARKFFDARPDETVIHPVVNGFTGSSIWHALYASPPTSQAFLEKGFVDFAKRWTPILDVFEEEAVNFALEVHPTEIAFDIGYAGPLSIEWEDGRMDRIHGGTEAAEFTRKVDFKPNAMAFDAAFSKTNQ